MANTSVSSIQPNLRFGTSFLDTKYRERGVNGESLMDKRTGEVAYKRVSDGSLIYFDREKLKLDDYIAQLSALKNDYPKFKYPASYNCKDVENTFFMTTMIDLQDFIQNSSEIEYGAGGIYSNNLLEKNGSFTFSQEMNGIYLNLMARPRDLALIDFCAGIYNQIVKNYDGEDETLLSEKKLFDEKGYEESNAKVQYLITSYDQNGGVTTFLKNGYVRLNQFSLSVFDELNITRENSKYCTIKIMNVSLHKMKLALDYVVKDENALKVYKSLIDDDKMNERIIALTHLYIGSFVTKDNYTILPTDYNNPYNRIINFIQLPAYESALKTIAKVGFSGAVYVNPSEPGEEIVNGITLWIERFRNVYAKGITEDIEDAETSMKDLEDLFGRVETIDGRLTKDSTDLSGFFVGLKNASGNFSDTEELTNYTINSTLKW